MNDTPRPSLASRLIWALPLALVPYLALAWRFAFITDDSFISFRYARNLAAGKGLVYNPGTTPPVEGYSEFLWVLMIAPFEALGMRPEGPAMFMGLLAGAALIIWVLTFLAKHLAPGKLALGAAALLLGCAPPMAVWTTGGMGTMAFSLAVFGLYERLFGERDKPHAIGAAICASLCVLLRADGALFVFLFGGLGLAIGALRKDRCLLRAALTASAVSAAVFGAHVLWRYGYYDDWLPNTARAKIGGSAFALERGAKYVLHFALTMPGLVLAALLPLAFGRRTWERPTIAAACGLLGLVAYSLWAGGDFMAFGRFLLPGIPLAVILGAKAFAALEEDNRKLALGVLAALCISTTLAPAFGLHATPESLRAKTHFRFNARQADGSALFRSELQQWQDMQARSAEWSSLGRAVAAHTDPADSLVAGAIGAIGYESDRKLYDQFGLVTRDVALRPAGSARLSPGHDKYVPPAFFDARRPTWSRAFLLFPGATVDVRTLRVPPERVKVVMLSEADGVPTGTRLVLIPPPLQ